jgi:hypothetical protein
MTEPKGCRPDISDAFPIYGMMPGLQPSNCFNAPFLYPRLVWFTPLVLGGGWREWGWGTRIWVGVDRFAVGEALADGR